MRIVSLLPAATEIVCRLGRGDALVGRSHECDFPASVTTLPVCSRPRIAVDGTSAEIDRGIRDIVARGLSVFEVDPEQLAALEPDVVVTQTQCEVCAVSPSDLERAVCNWVGAEPRIVSLEPHRLADVWTDIERVGDAVAASGEARDTVHALRARMQRTAERARAQRTAPSVVCIEWMDPLMAGGNWMPELVSMAGGHNLFTDAGEHSPPFAFDALRRADPEVVVVVPCGFELERTRADIEALTRRPGWQELRAVREGRVCIADGHHYFNRPGPRLAESLEILAEILHPDAFDFGHEGTGWVRLAR